MIWEYKEDLIPKGDLVNVLNQWGAMGWELCGIIEELELGFRAIFKRQVNEIF